eukprot:1879881-Prymnesium_polylepis.1
MQARPVLATSPLSERPCAPDAPARRRPRRLDRRRAPHVRMHASANATAVESRKHIAMESGFSRPLERV